MYEIKAQLTWSRSWNVFKLFGLSLYTLVMVYSQNSDHEYSQQPPEEEFELPLLPYAEYPLPQVIDDLDFSD